MFILLNCWVFLYPNNLELNQSTYAYEQNTRRQITTIWDYFLILKTYYAKRQSWFLRHFIKVKNQQFKI